MGWKIHKKLLVILWALVIPIFPANAAVTGKVISITDGDTFILLTQSKKQIKVRLAEIDTPEKGQPYSAKSKKALATLIAGKTVRVEVVDIDRWKRTVSHVYTEDGTHVNKELVKGGYAWVFRKYSKDKTLLALEEQARSNKRGIWALPEAQRVPPWQWRELKRSGKSVGEAQKEYIQNQAAQSAFQCGRQTLTCIVLSSQVVSRYNVRVQSRNKNS